MAQTPHYNSHGFPSTLIVHNSDYNDGVVVEDGLLNTSKSHIFTGNLTDYELLAPRTGKFLVIKGVTITGNGNAGTVKLSRSIKGNVIFPAYFSVLVKGSPSSAFNLILEDNEKILLTTTDRGTSETFVGITYIEFDKNVE